MGVPALFRWLSKKYPKIIYPVIEEEAIKVPVDDGESVTIPVDITSPNPNGCEFDNLYLDMNGIVHPCTHPEGKPAPETEEEMMVEIFNYTERIVNMVRPRKLLFMAIDGVAPRAKMNQQRSRRFRSSQEAKDKEEARKESVALWEAMGKTLSEEEKIYKEAWDSNAITPGTPFMDLLAISLRYWIVRKINTDPGWKKVQVIISDASVPGEGEHKIMDFIRRQRTNPGHDPNTRHVIYGLDADLIMLSLATHEPHFKVLREDVFFQSGSATACRICGQEGHFAAQCTGVKAEMTKKVVPPEKKPFIFLDISVLREYLEVELYVPQASFPFNFEQAIDDWVLLIFFVGNDFLPHLPSLEIREGAIDTLLKIWKQELPRMGGYLTRHGQIELSRAQIIIEGLAQREDEIFRRRREHEERQNHGAKRQRLTADTGGASGPSPSLQLTTAPTAPSALPVHPSLPQRPAYDFADAANGMGFGAPPSTQSAQRNASAAAQALAGSNRDVVANRRAIRLANMSAAEMLKAELSGSPPKPASAPKHELDLSLPAKPPAIVTPASLPPASTEAVPMSDHRNLDDTDWEIPGLRGNLTFPAPLSPPAEPDDQEHTKENGHHEQEAMIAPTDAVAVDQIPDSTETDAMAAEQPADDEEDPTRGVKRKFEEDDDTEDMGDDDEESPPAVNAYAFKVNPDGTVEQEDSVKLWEPGYKQRYYKQKFDVDATDEEFKMKVTKAYVEGLAWVLHYYYQGPASWHWFYPYHFAPFAADFKNLDKLEIKFDLGHPFKPFEQLMAVFPAASRKHLPASFQLLMVTEDSPIIDFYPTTFEIDMNGKRMAWQGVALLPFIDEKRLLDSMAPEYPKLTDDENRRNRWGNNIMYVSDQHALYPLFESLYGKKRRNEPAPLTSPQSYYIAGSVLPDSHCLPGSTYDSPLTGQGLPDIRNDRSISVVYLFPKQLSPHRSQLLPGARPPPRILAPEDSDRVRFGSYGGGQRGRRDAHGNGPTRPADYQNGYPNKYSSARNTPPYNSSNHYDYNRRPYGAPAYSHDRSGSSYSQQPRNPPYSSPGYGNYRGGGPAYNTTGRDGQTGYGGYSGRDSAGGGYGGYGVYGSGGGPGGFDRGHSGEHQQGSGYGPPSRGRGRGWRL